MKHCINPILKMSVLAVALSTAVSAAAEQASGFTFTPRLEYQLLDKDQVPAIDDPYFGGLSLGYKTSSPWGFELTYLNGKTERANSNAKVDTEVLRLDALYYFRGNEGVQPYLLIGGGKQSFDYRTFKIENDLFNAGAGLSIAVNDLLKFRTELRVINDLENEWTSYAVGLGLNFLFGGTPAKAKEVVVPPPVDSDGDGVPDTIDRCPGTPVGTPVDAYGCPLVLDDDGDGVPNHLDKCPGTTAGARVDEHGCYIIITETHEETLNIVFKTSSAEVSQEYYAEIERIAKFLREYPRTQVNIEGHTDSSGAVGYNINLSQQRADAVAKILVEHFGIAQSRVSATGYGPARPIVSNDTAENRAKNRRVNAKVTAQVERIKQ